MGSTDPADPDQPPHPGSDDPGLDLSDQTVDSIGVDADGRPGGGRAIVLAAGRGMRMRSELPKVLHPIAGRAMVLHVLQALRAGGVGQAVVVTGYGASAVEGAVEAAVEAGRPDGLAVSFVRQKEPLGTGHAALQAREVVPAGDVLIVNGDLALITAADVRALREAPASCLALAAARVSDPSGLGRVRREGERLLAVVEEADADAATAAIHEVNVGLYRVDAAWLWRTLEALPASASGEIYLTDAVARAAAEGEAVAVSIEAPEGSLSVESRGDLARAEAVMRRRINARWMNAGVTIVDPATTYIDAGVEIGADTRLEPGTHLRGATSLGRRNVVGPHAVLTDTRTGDGCVLVQCSSTGAVLGEGVDVGPFSTLREGTVLDERVHIGTHAETKNAHLHRDVMVGHFSYLGDAEVGAGSNIGAGAITCNFDGAEKQRTVIGAGCFIGSDTMLIAPITLGDGASTAAASVVNKDVPAGGMAIGHPARMRRGRRAEAES